MTNAQGPVLVTAATGKTGRRVLAMLKDRGIDARGVTRADGFDWDAPDTWAPVIGGARAAYLAYAPDLALPGAGAKLAGFTRVAQEHGVERFVLLSGRGEETALEAEQAVRAVHPATTVVRCSFFAQNFDEGFLVDAVAAGELALPKIDTPEPFVDVEDVAEVAATVLAEGGHEGETYVVTGSELFTFEQAAQLLGAKAVAVPVEAWRAELTGAGLPPELVELLTYLFTEVLDGRNSSVADGVERALGRRARSFAEFAESQRQSKV
ncbi:SDR family oxidoreductase [Paractinoplanes lichenicola]|uniref:NmrA family transcriptional regulator n=1 Tax=Paractinoplanes lichenicola TaxID=2802976 RepID=A0ABS1VT20_9ACTN|nr:NmrA family transcriptional regulator [Actinoplanes lichenicola]MBL7257621.1 NmrA family transcriptional regulator [Actinoplanes lichenicola]